MFRKIRFSDPINGIYIMHSVRSLASSLINIYVPVYLLKLGYSLTEVLSFWLIYSLCVFVFCVLTAFISDKVGLKKIVIISIFLQFAYLFMLGQISALQIPLTLVAIVSGMQAAFYWFPINVFFATHSDTLKIGRSVGKLIALPKFLTLPAPIIAGVVVVLFGFNFLFLISGFFYLASLIPLALIPEYTGRLSLNLNSYWTLFRNNIRYFGAEFLENIREEMEYIVLPIFIFITFANILSVGWIGTFAKLGGILFTLFVGKLSDNKDKKKLMKIGVLIMITVWIIRYFVPNAIVFYAFSLIVGLVEVLVLVPFTSIIYQNAKENHPVEFLLFRELAVSLARVSVYAVMIMFAGNLPTAFLLPIISLFAFNFY